MAVEATSNPFSRISETRWKKCQKASGRMFYILLCILSSDIVGNAKQAALSLGS